MIVIKLNEGAGMNQQQQKFSKKKISLIQTFKIAPREI